MSKRSDGQAIRSHGEPKRPFHHYNSSSVPKRPPGQPRLNPEASTVEIFSTPASQHAAFKDEAVPAFSSNFLRGSGVSAVQMSWVSSEDMGDDVDNKADLTLPVMDQDIFKKSFAEIEEAEQNTAENKGESVAVEQEVEESKEEDDGKRKRAATIIIFLCCSIAVLVVVTLVFVLLGVLVWGKKGKLFQEQ